METTRPKNQPPPTEEKPIAFTEVCKNNSSNTEQRTNINAELQRDEDFITGVLVAFTCERMKFDGYEVLEAMSRRHESVVDQAQAIALKIRNVEDENANNKQLNRLYSRIRITEGKYELFEEVAAEIFVDGINWEKILLLIYLGYKLTLKVFDDESLIMLVIKWIARYLCKHVVGWITENGGWLEMNTKVRKVHPIENDETQTMNDELLVTDESYAIQDTGDFQSDEEKHIFSIAASFIISRMTTDGYEVPQQLNQNDLGLNDEEFKYIVDTLREAGDRLEKDKRLNKIFSKTKFDKNTKFVAFAKIAGEIFSDGINWIKIIMLFYLAYKLAIKAIDNVKLILKTLKFVTRYIFTELLQWINSTGGGWNHLVLRYGVFPKVKTAAVVVTAMASAALVVFAFYYKSKK